MVLPGPEAQQLATYTGWLLHGVKGGLTAGILFILPSIFILLGLSSIYVLYGNVPVIASMFDALQPAIIAIVLGAVVKIGKKSLISLLHYIIATISFVGIFFLNIPFPFIILGALLTGLVVHYYTKNKNDKQEQSAILEEEKSYFISAHSVPKTEKTSRAFIKIGIAVLLWAIPFAVFKWWNNDVAFWTELSMFFTKAALVTFGGAYAVLPYVAQVSVEQLQWLSYPEMMDGLALGETTPGPLVMVLAFVGFMAGYNHFNSSLLMGSLGLLTTVFYTFLPCFLFILVGAPFIEKTRENPILKQILSFVTAAVVGVILNLSLVLGNAVLFVNKSSFDFFGLIWIAISFIALQKFKMNMMVWILISAVSGILRFYLKF